MNNYEIGLACLLMILGMMLIALAITKHEPYIRMVVITVIESLNNEPEKWHHSEMYKCVRTKWVRVEYSRCCRIFCEGEIKCTYSEDKLLRIAIKKWSEKKTIQSLSSNQ